MSRFSIPAYLRLTAISLLLATSAVLTWDGRATAQERKLQPPAGEARALVIGIDAYQFELPLKGAAADARDIASALRHSGVTDVGSLLDAAADRASILRSLNGLLSRSGPGDLVILSVAGRGAQEAAHFKNSQADAREDVLILAGFDPNTTVGSQQRILRSE